MTGKRLLLPVIFYFTPDYASFWCRKRVMQSIRSSKLEGKQDEYHLFSDPDADRLSDRPGRRNITWPSKVSVAKEINSSIQRRLHMLGIDMVLILLLISFIGGLIVGVSLVRPTIYH
jgi:hypothetical protein